MSLDWTFDQALAAIGLAGAVFVGSASWMALRGVGMGRLGKAIDLAARLQEISDDDERLLLQVRYYALLRKEHFPSRRWVGILVIGLWVYAMAALLWLAVWLNVGIRGWTMTFGTMALVSLYFNGVWDTKLALHTPRMLTHQVLIEKEESTWERYLNLNGHPPREHEDFDARMKRRERYNRWVRPIKERLGEQVERHPRARSFAKLILALGWILFMLGMITGQWPW